jgi:predicted nuclease of restriction endonuclease-like (RecB) superfamily
MSRRLSPVGMDVPLAAPAGNGIPIHPADYAAWLDELKTHVRATQFRAARAANAEVVHLYWSIGRDILERQKQQAWGAKVIERLAQDLRAAFPGQRGWSPTNIKYMRMFAAAWPKLPEICPQPVDKLPWSHIRLLIDKLPAPEDRDWHAQKAVAEGWSRAVLGFQIETKHRQRLSRRGNCRERHCHRPNPPACLPLCPGQPARHPEKKCALPAQAIFRALFHAGGQRFLIFQLAARQRHGKPFALLQASEAPAATSNQCPCPSLAPGKSRPAAAALGATP